ncbi:hypothetical protein [Streptomyces sp. NPDC058656]|uniref:hypothetical protein n=1 Tax=unclassified Streptomyces TaxID=2593676 RepID=UPI00364DC81E
MSTPDLTPVCALDDAVAKAHAAAKAMLPLVGHTLHVQFPAGAYLVLARPVDSDDESVFLDSIRDSAGGILHEFDEWARTTPEPLPAVPEEITALWGSLDPRSPSQVLSLIQRIDEVAPYAFVDFLPEELWSADEIEAESDGGRPPLGIPLAASVCVLHGAQCPAQGHVEPSPALGEVI